MSQFPKNQHDRDALLNPGELKRWVADIVDNKFAVCHVCLRAWRRVDGKRYFETSPQIFKHHRSVSAMHTVICPECAASEEDRWKRQCVSARVNRKSRIAMVKILKSERDL